jgi:hypothetical protein
MYFFIYDDPEKSAASFLLTGKRPKVTAPTVVENTPVVTPVNPGNTSHAKQMLISPKARTKTQPKA